MGWLNLAPAPTIQDLLPPEILQRFLDIWLMTGDNFLYTHALVLLADIEESNDAHKMIAESMEANVYNRLEDIRAKWRKEDEEA